MFAARDIRFYEDSIDLCFYSDYSTRVGCIAAKGNKRIVGAYNTVRNGSLSIPFGQATYHAEINVLRMLPKTDKVTLYIARIGSQEQRLPSRPCNRCIKEILDTDIKEIVYLDKFMKVVKERL